MRAICILLLASCFWARAQDDAAGRWEGAIQIPGRELHLIVDLARGGAEEWQGSIIIPELNLAGAALTEIAQSGTDLTFAIKSALAEQKSGPAKFSAQRAADGKMAGEFTQGGQRAPFSLIKIGPPQITTPPRSTPITKEIEGEWKGEYELFGYPRQVTIKLRNRGADGATADFLIVGKKENRLPVDLVTQEGSYLAIDSHETGLSFEGRVGKDELKGTILQGPLEIPVTLKRAK